jgi:hypothetical protein
VYAAPVPARLAIRPLVTLLLALLAGLSFATAASAQTPSNCEQAVQTWARACPDLGAACVRGIVCPPGSVILEVGCHPDDLLRVEIARAGPRAFRQVGDVGVSPVGNFPDWSQVAEGKRRAFDEVSACLARDPSLISPAAPRASGKPPAHARGSSPPWPWRLLLGLLLGAVVCAGRMRGVRNRRTIGLLGLLFAGTLALRWLAFPAAFFHPNGQGAFWIACALDTDGSRFSYGPGYWEMFGWLARLPLASPEALVIGAQAALGALSPVCAWVVAREMGASRLLAWGSALVVAQSPILARISQSQSYYGTWASLLFVATAILMIGCPRKGEGRRRFALAVLAAGLVVAQAARVTPIGWTAASVLPLAVAARPGPLGARLRWAVAAAFGIGAVVAVTSGSAMLGVLRGPLGSQWLPETTARGLEPAELLRPALLVVAIIVLASRHRASAAVRVLAAAVTLLWMDATCMIRSHPAILQRAFEAMWAPVLVGLAAALVADLRARALRGAAAVGLVSWALVSSVRTWQVERELPTNVLEALWAEQWRGELPPGSTVVYLGRMGQHILVLPLYGEHTRVAVEPWVLAHDAPVPDLRQMGSNVHYYESSLCAGREARELCRALREQHGLVPIESRTLPARSSASTSFFEEDTVTVGLYRLQ